MSNANIASRLTNLVDDYAQGIATLGTLASQLLGHAEALEGMDYRQVKEAQLVHAQLAQAIETGRENDIDKGAVLAWLRAWIAKIPV